MRVLLTANASYAPPKGGSTRSNLIWLEHLARNGHECRVVCGGDDKSTIVDGIDIRSFHDLSLRASEILGEQVRDFRPDYVLVSSEDVAHTLLRAASAAAPDKLVYLAHTPQWYPFGPASWHPDPQATEIVRRARAVIAIGQTTAEYIRKHTGVRASVVHPPMYGEPPWPRLGSFSSGSILMINPSVVKGISIFLELARQFPHLEFAGLAGWGTTSRDREAMAALANVRILETVGDIEEALAQARLLLMPSLWYEGFGLIAMEAMLRGLPVISSDSGGLVEAKRGTGYVIPIKPIEKFEARFDETHMPVPVDVPQEIGAWVAALRELVTDEAAWQRESDRSRAAAEEFVAKLDAADFERALLRMRILLAHNSLYYPSHGGGDKSNRLLMEALAARGHEVRVVSRVEAFGPADGNKLLEDLRARGVEPEVNEEGIVHFHLNGVDVHTVAYQSGLRPWFSKQIAEFSPDIIVTSTDDPGQLLFDLALKAPRARVVYLIRATIAVPFGPDSSAPNAAKTETLKRADGVVGVSQYVARYASELGAIHVPISLLDPGPEPPMLGSFDNPYVTMTNPCAVKGIDIFLALAARMPHVKFAAVPTWGTNPEDYARLQQHPNIEIVPPVDNIDDLMRITKVMLVPSVWAEARSRIVVEAMERGVPVVSSDAGGIPEAHLGVDYMIPVNLITQYKPAVDMNMVPVAEVPPQDIEPWVSALTRLTNDRSHWEDLARQSREAALNYARSISVVPFESFLRDLLAKPKKSSPAPLSDDKRRLLALLLKKKASGPLAGLEDVKPEGTLVALPWAGGGTLQYRKWGAVAVRLPGRESRISEAPFEDMQSLLATLGPVIKQEFNGKKYVLFGHSMGAGIAFELTRWLRKNSGTLPCGLIVSAARAPQFRLDWTPPPDPSDEELLEQLELPDRKGMELIMPALRADTRLYRRYVYEPGEPLPVPIFAYGGLDDPRVRPEHLTAWREQTTASFTYREFPGAHFYFMQEQDRLQQVLRSDVSAAVQEACS